MLRNLCRANRGTFVFKDVLDDFYLELRKKYIDREQIRASHSKEWILR